MAYPAVCTYSSLGPAARVCTAPRRRPASPFLPVAAPARVHLPPAARTAPRSLSTSLSVLRPRVHRCDSDPERARDGAVVGLPTVEEPRHVRDRDALDVVEDDEVVYPLGLTGRELREYRDTDFSRDAIGERFRRESKEAKAAVIGAVTGVVRPLRQLLDDVRSIKSVVDAEEFQIGMPFGAIMTCMGMYQLWKLSPSTCIDVAMYYAFYKLSVIAADLRRRGFSPDWIIRIKFGIISAVLVKDLAKAIVPLDYVRGVIFFIYGLSVGWDLKGLKKFDGRMFLPMVIHMAKHPMEAEPQWKRVKPTEEVLDF